MQWLREINKKDDMIYTYVNTAEGEEFTIAIE